MERALFRVLSKSITGLRPARPDALAAPYTVRRVVRNMPHPTTYEAMLKAAGVDKNTMQQGVAALRAAQPKEPVITEVIVVPQKPTTLPEIPPALKGKVLSRRAMRIVNEARRRGIPYDDYLLGAADDASKDGKNKITTKSPRIKQLDIVVFNAQTDELIAAHKK